MLDFTNCTKLPNDYAGSERKTKIIFNDEIYMLKFPDPIREKKAKISYANNQYSEYIGCHVAQIHGLKAQETLLGTYVVNGKTRVCVACRDFCNGGMFGVNGN